MLIFQGRVNTFESSIVASYHIASIAFGSPSGVKRSVTFSASLVKLPARGEQVPGLKPGAGGTKRLPLPRADGEAIVSIVGKGIDFIQVDRPAGAGVLENHLH